MASLILRICKTIFGTGKAVFLYGGFCVTKGNYRDRNKRCIFWISYQEGKILPSQVKDRFGAEVAFNSDLVMLCYTTIPSTSNTLKNLLVKSNYHSSYNNQEFNNKKEQLSTIFSTYVTPQIK